MLNRFLLIAIIGILCFVSFTLHSISRKIDKLNVSQDKNTIATLETQNKNNIQDDVVQNQESSIIPEAKEEIWEETKLPAQWMHLKDTDVQKIFFTYDEQDIELAKNIKKIIEDGGNDISVYLNSQKEVKENEKALASMNALVILVTSNSSQNIVQTQEYQSAKNLEVPVINLSPIPVEDNFETNGDQLIQITPENQNFIQENILQIIQNNNNKQVNEIDDNLNMNDVQEEVDFFQDPKTKDDLVNITFEE